jgi:hypothetical protein
MVDVSIAARKSGRLFAQIEGETGATVDQNASSVVFAPPASAAIDAGCALDVALVSSGQST